MDKGTDKPHRRSAARKSRTPEADLHQPDPQLAERLSSRLAQSVELLRHSILNPSVTKFHNSTMVDVDSSDASEIDGELMMLLRLNELSQLLKYKPEGMELVVEGSEDDVDTRQILEDVNKLHRLVTLPRRLSFNGARLPPPSPQRSPQRSPHRSPQRSPGKPPSPNFSLQSHRMLVVLTLLLSSLLGLPWRQPGDLAARNRLNTSLDDILPKNAKPAPIQPLQTEFKRLLANGTTSKLTRSPTSPWNRQPRQSSLDPVKPKLFGKKGYHIPHTITEVLTAQRVEELTKEITSYKIQLKFFKQFIQTLIQRSRSQESQYDDFNTLVADFLPEHMKLGRLQKLELEYQMLEKNYEEVFKLNEDLYENLELFENQLHDKDNQFRHLTERLDASGHIVDDILYTLISSPHTDDLLRMAISKCVDDIARPLDMKMHIVRLELNKILESGAINNDDIAGHVQVTEKLMASIEVLKKEIESQKHERQLIEMELTKEVEESKLIKKNFQVILQKFTALCSALEQEDKDTVLMLEIENDGDFSKRMAAYQNDIDNINAHDDSLAVISELNHELEQFSSKYAQLQAELADTIKSLTAQLRHHQLVLVRDGDFDQAQAELAIALEKQRILKTEKTRLMATVDQLTLEKDRLQLTISGLTERMMKDDNLLGLVLEFELEEMLKYDVSMFSKLWKLFDKIADDQLFKEPTKRLNALKRVVKDDDNWYRDGYVRDQHKYIFEYFGRAVEILVNDHVKLLLAAPLVGSVEHVAQLHKRINELELINDSLLAKLDDLVDDTTGLDVLKMKMEEILNRFKAEREQRIYENNQAQLRLNELEAENARLRDLVNEH